jgi:hypothetical protein
VKTSFPLEVEVSRPSLTEMNSTFQRRKLSRASSRSLVERPKRSNFQTMTTSILPARASASRRSRSGSFRPDPLPVSQYSTLVSAAVE